MKIVRFAIEERVEYGILNGRSIQALDGEPFPEMNLSDRHYRLGEVRPLAPCLPAKIVALRLNYHRYARETNAKIPNLPSTFIKPSTAIVGPEDSVVYPSVPARVDYEGELGVVMKQPAWRVSVDEALDYVLGYTCFNDITVRNLEEDKKKRDGPSHLSAIGPCIETELDPAHVTLKTYVNGKLKQEGNTADLIYSVAEIINFISHVTGLRAGDIIATGAPTANVPVYPGDTVEVKIAPIGNLRNYVVSDGGPDEPSS